MERTAVHSKDTHDKRIQFGCNHWTSKAPHLLTGFLGRKERKILATLKKLLRFNLQHEASGQALPLCIKIKLICAYNISTQCNHFL